MDLTREQIENLRERLISYGDATVQERHALCDMALRARAEGEADSYVGWCRFHDGRFSACDSDSEGAFKVYRHSDALRTEVQDLSGHISADNDGRVWGDDATSRDPLQNIAGYIGWLESRIDTQIPALKQVNTELEARLEAITISHPAPSGMRLVPEEPTKAMVSAYLDANAAYWVEHDKLPSPIGKWRSGTAKEATMAGYRAMLAAAPGAK